MMKYYYIAIRMFKIENTVPNGDSVGAAGKSMRWYKHFGKWAVS